MEKLSEISPVLEQPTKFCKSCIHSKSVWQFDAYNYHCTKFATISPIDGSTYPSDAHFERSSVGHCKVEGIYYEAYKQSSSEESQGSPIRST